MIETLEQKKVVLDHCGESIIFLFGTILAIPSQSVYNVQSFDSVYDIEKQDFTFQIILQDYLDNLITKGMTFIYTNGSRDYTFKILSAVDDLLGWVSLQVSLEKVAINV